MEKVVNLIGMGKGSLALPDTGENWGINKAFIYGKMDKLFFMDGMALELEEEKLRDPNELKFFDALNKYPEMELISKNLTEELIFNKDGSVLMINGQAKKISNYPLMQALELCPGAYFTCTAAYVIAYAILNKVDRIRLYGFQVWSNFEANEYMYQRPCLDFWLSFAMGRGIKIEIPWYLLKTMENSQNMYGFLNPAELKGRV